MTDANSDSKKIGETVARLVATHKHLVEINEEKVWIDREIARIDREISSSLSSFTLKHDAWKITLIILIIVEFVWLLGMIWGVM